VPSSAQSCPQDHGQFVYLLTYRLIHFFNLYANYMCDYPRLLSPCSFFLLLCLFSASSSSFYRYEYLWEDGVRYKRPTKLPAPEYVDALMNWAQQILDDENIFPNKLGARLQLY
jgi:hypothetical protein